MAKHEEYSVEDAVSVAFGIVQELAEEMRSWHDNMLVDEFENADDATTPGLEEFINELDNVIGELEGVEFPGMFG